MPNLCLWPILEQLTIRTKKGKHHRLNRNDRFAWAQREFVGEVERQYNAGEPVRINVLKGRQLGISTITEAILFIWCFLHPGTNGLVLSKDQESSDYLFGMYRLYWEKGPFIGLFDTRYNSQGYIEWNGLGSSVTTDTAKKEDVGRSKTIQAAHCSEVAFWTRPDEIVPALMEAIPHEHGTIIVMESTAQGVGGYFHDEWVKAVERRSSFTPMFFPWFCHEEYEIPDHHLRFADLADDERELLEDVPALTLPKLAWRRRKLQTYANPETFKQEYPSSPEEAFLSTGSNVFDLQKLTACYDPHVESEQGFLYNDNGSLKFVEDLGGHTFVYRRPDPARKRRYAIGCDPSKTVEGDPACIQVLDRASHEQVAVWHGHADPETVGEIALALAYWYGPDCLLNTEVQGGGRRAMMVWRDANYPCIWYDRRPDRPKIQTSMLGWNSTYETKRLLLGMMKGVIIRRQTKIHHPSTFYEMTHYIFDSETDEYRPARRSGHDDCVMAYGVALMTVVTESQNLDFQAMAAPEPAYIPGMTPPRFPGQGRPLEQIPALSRLAAVGMTDETIGIDEYY